MFSLNIVHVYTNVPNELVLRVMQKRGLEYQIILTYIKMNFLKQQI